MADGEDITICPVCSEAYEAKGEHVPRILPCIHTVCERCIRGKLFQGTSLECPQCGSTHYAKDGIKNVSKNNYIITYLMKQAEKHERKEECNEHGKEKNLFCNERDCQLPICLLCLKDGHKGHDFEDLEQVMEEKRREELKTSVQSLKTTLQTKKDDLLSVQKKVVKNCQKCATNIINNKEKLIKKLNERVIKLIQDVTEEKKKADAGISETVAKIDGHLVMLSNIEKNRSSKLTRDDVQERLETVNEIAVQVTNSLSETKIYTALTYNKCSAPTKHVTALCGLLSRKKKDIKISKTTARKKDPTSTRETVTQNAEQTEDAGTRAETEYEAISVGSSPKLKPGYGPPKTATSHLAYGNGGPSAKSKTTDPAVENADVCSNAAENTSEHGYQAAVYGHQVYGHQVDAASVYGQAAGNPSAYNQQVDNTVVYGHPVDYRTAYSHQTGNRPVDVPQATMFRASVSNMHANGGEGTVIDNTSGAPAAKKIRLDAAPQSVIQGSYKVIHSLTTPYTYMNVMDVLSDDSVLVCGKVQYRRSRRMGRKLTQYNQATGEKLYTSWLEQMCVPDGMAMITSRDGYQLLVMSYGKRKRMEFFEISSLRTPIRSHSVAPDQPGRLCTSLPGTLLYVAFQPNKQIVKQLDCSTYPPTPLDVITNIRTHHANNLYVQDMCLVTNENKQLLITTHNYGGIHAYDMAADKLEWCVRGNLGELDRQTNAAGVTTNRHDTLLVCDMANACVQMFTPNGVYLGAVLGYGHQGLGSPLRIRRCNTDTLIVTHERNSYCCMSVFQYVKENGVSQK